MYRADEEVKHLACAREAAVSQRPKQEAATTALARALVTHAHERR